MTPGHTALSSVKSFQVVRINWKIYSLHDCIAQAYPIVVFIHFFLAICFVDLSNYILRELVRDPQEASRSCVDLANLELEYSLNPVTKQMVQRVKYL